VEVNVEDLLNEARKQARAACQALQPLNLSLVAGEN